MNLQSKKARIPIAALGVAALTCGAGALFNPAQAVGTDLGYGPTPASATIVDVNPNSNGLNGSLTYGFKVTGSTDTTSPTILVAGASNPGNLYVSRYSANTTPNYTTTLSAATAVGATSFTVPSSAGIAVGDVVSVGAGASAESLTVATVPDGTHFTTGAATNAHAIGDPVSIVTNTTLGASSSVGATSFTVASSAQISVGSKVQIGSGTSAETLTVATVPDGTHITTTTGAANAHSSGDRVYVGAFYSVAASATRTLASYTNGDNVFVGATVPGDYTFYVFKDVNGNGSYDAAQDDATPSFTLHVKDVTGNTATASDDLDFGLSAPSSSGLGQTIPVTATMTGLTTTDTRGGNTLGNNIAEATNLTFAGAAGASAGNGTATYNTTSNKFTGSSGPVTAAGTVTTTASLASATANTSTIVANNGVTGLTLAPSAVTGSVVTDATTSTQVDVKTGTGSATYSATATGAGSTPVSGATVYFTIGGTATEVGNITTDGTTVDTSSTTSHVYSAVTDSNGVATLKVTSSATAAATTYTVSARSNNVASTPPTLTALYQDPTAATVSITSSSADLTPVAGSGATATIKGKLTDQFGAAYTTSTGSQQAQIFIGTTGSSCTAAPVTGNPAATTATANTVVSNGTFTYSYTPSTSPTTGQCTTFDVAYDANNNSTIQSSESAGGVVYFGTSTPAASLTLATPADGATAVTVQANGTPNAAQANAGTPPFGNTTGAVTGTVHDAGGAALPYKAVVLSGGEGVYFDTQAVPDATHQLATTLATVTNASGAIQNAYVFFTKSGTKMVTATSGAVSDSATVTVLNPTTGAYTVTAENTAGTPGSTMILTGTVKDVFGNGVAGATVNLTTDAQTVGVVTNSTVTTNSAGDWSTTFVTGSNQNGDVTLHATINGGAAASTPATGLATAGLTGLSSGDNVADATITVANVAIGIGSDAPSNTASSGASGARVAIRGSFIPGATVQIMAKPAGSSTFSFIGAALVKSDGTYQKTFTVKKSTVFIVQSEGMVSSTKTITIKSTVTLSAKSSKAGMVTLAGNGNPNGKYKLAFYRSKSGADPRVAYVTSNSSGAATVTVSAPRGTDKYYVVFQAPGTSKGTSKMISVKIK